MFGIAFAAASRGLKVDQYSIEVVLKWSSRVNWGWHQESVGALGVMNEP